MSAPLIHINGWPGSGKRTIAHALRRRIGGRVLDNHLLLDPAGALFDRGTAEHGALREALRAVLYEAAEGLSDDVPLIVTDALAASDSGTPLIEATLDLARRRGAVLVPVVLDLTLDENTRRLVDPAREGRAKLTDPQVLHSLREAHELLSLPGARHVEVSDLSPDQAAERIAALLPGT